MTATYDLETKLHADHACIAWVDEVGRGCLAGPVYCAVTITTSATPSAHPAVADSKLVPAHQRAELATAAQQWVTAWAIGTTSAADIDRSGIAAALRTATLAALEQLADIDLHPTLICFDGTHPLITRHDTTATLHAQPKLDATSAACAAASLIAKVARDAHMAELATTHTHWGFDDHAGYGTPTHLAAINEHGLSSEHRASFCTRIPGPHQRHHQLGLEL